MPGTGIIEQQLPDPTTVAAPPPGQVTAAPAIGMTPATRGVTTDETVAGQMDKVMASGSPLVQRARTSAAQVANSRGLLNSSMGVQAGEEAALSAALPIATADAQTSNVAARENMAATNQAGAFNADAANKASLVNVTASNDLGLQELKGNQATDLANIEANYKGLIQASSSAGTIYSDAIKSMAAIMADKTTTAATKQAAIDLISQNLQGGLALIGGMNNIDVSELLDFTPGSTSVPGAVRPGTVMQGTLLQNDSGAGGVHGGTEPGVPVYRYPDGTTGSTPTKVKG